MQHLPISIIIIAHQDRPAFKKTIQSVQWANDILIYWTSQVKIPEWLRMSNVRFVNSSIDQIDFSAYRNDAATFATENTLFFVDSDESVSNGTAQILATLINRSDWQAATVRRKDIFLGKEMRWGEVAHVQIARIFKKGFFHYERAVHEQAAVNGTVVESQITLIHEAHQSFSEFLNDVIQYIQIESNSRQKNKQHVSLLALCIWPLGKFLHNYFFKLGILDGWRGVIYALTMSVHSFGVRASIYERTT